MNSLCHSTGKIFLISIRNEVRVGSCNNINSKVPTARFSLVARSLSIENEADSCQDVMPKDNKSTRPQNFGSFQNLPMVKTSKEIIYSALKKARIIAPTQGIKNLTKRERNRGAKQLDALMKELAVPLRHYIEKFPKRHRLHPYEQSLITFTFGRGKYEEVLGNVDSLRKKIGFVGKEHASLCAKSKTKWEAQQRLNEGFSKLEELIQRKGEVIDELVDVAKKLRAMPTFDLTLPTLCLVGAPNVGKSSLVRVLSSGKPEVCNYPFTTRSILMGHIFTNHEIFQITDTPGLLRRNDEDRNKLEKLTLAALEHLPTAILFVHDLSGHCGTSATDQLYIYNDIKERFGDRLWIDVVSKADMWSCPEGVETIEEQYKAFGPKGSLHVSVKTNQGIEELKQNVYDILVRQSKHMESVSS